MVAAAAQRKFARYPCTISTCLLPPPSPPPMPFIIFEEAFKARLAAGS